MALFILAWVVSVGYGSAVYMRVMEPSGSKEQPIDHTDTLGYSITELYPMDSKFFIGVITLHALIQPIFFLALKLIILLTWCLKTAKNLL